MFTRENAMTRAFEFMLKSEVEGHYVEFGVFQGKSICSAVKSYRKLKARYNSDSDVQFYAFDSFEGLPALTIDDDLEGYGVFEEGQYACSLETVTENLQRDLKDISNMNFFPGFYNQSLISDAVLEKTQNTDFAIIHIDCDLYSSAKDCLDFIESRYTDGALILFDDWFCFRGRKDKGVQKAFYEWIENSSIEYTEYFKYAWSGICFMLHK